MIFFKKNQQFITFALIGAVGFFIDAGMFYALHGFFKINLYVGRIISFSTSATVTWLLNHCITFPDKQARSLVMEWLYYFVLMLAGGCINYTVYAMGIYFWALAYQYPIIAVAAGCLSGLFANFFFAKKLVFKMAG